jgi:hypothetical protein
MGYAKTEPAVAALSGLKSPCRNAFISWGEDFQTHAAVFAHSAAPD